MACKHDARELLFFSNTVSSFRDVEVFSPPPSHPAPQPKSQRPVSGREGQPSGGAIRRQLAVYSGRKQLASLLQAPQP